MDIYQTIAEWMLSELESDKKYLYQETVVSQIKNRFGKEYLYCNENGNLAIDRRILKEFKKLTDGTVVWVRGLYAWRKLKAGEQIKGRQVD